MIKIKILPHLIIIPAILATQPRSVHHSDWSTGVTSPKTLVTISSLLKYSKAKLSMHIYFISNWHLIVQHLMDSWLSSAKFWEFAFFQELLPLARAVQYLSFVLITKCILIIMKMKIEMKVKIKKMRNTRLRNADFPSPDSPMAAITSRS